MAWYDDALILVVHTLHLHKPPLAPIFLILVSVFINYLSGLITKLLVNQRELERYRKILMDFNQKKSKAMSEQDPKLWIAVKYYEMDMTEIQQQMMFKQMIPQLVMSGVFIGIFGLLRRIMGDGSLNLTPDRGGIVAVLPFKIPESTPIIGDWFSLYALDPTLSAAGFGFMYFMSAIFTSFILNRIFGVNPRQTMGR